MRVFGYDPGIVNHGLSCIDVENGEVKINFTKYIKAEQKQQHLKLQYIFNQIDDYFNNYSPDIFVYEEPVFKGRGINGSLINQCLGSVLTVCAIHGVRIFSYKQQEVKSLVFGKPVASKEELKNSVNAFLNIDREYSIDHESDSLAIVLAYLIKNRIIEIQKELKYKY